jgi:parallel beta-helix repeat protein
MIRYINSIFTTKNTLHFLGFVLLIMLLLLAFIRATGSIYPTEIGSTPRITIIPIQNISVYTKEPIHLTFTASSLSNTTLTYNINPLPYGAQMNITEGVFTWIPFPNQSGIHWFTVTATDGTFSTQKPILITVKLKNSPPVINPIKPISIVAGDLFRMQINASDPDGDPLKYYISWIPPGSTFDDMSGVLLWQTPPDQSGNITFTITAFDGWNSTQQHIDCTVYPTNTVFNTDFLLFTGLLDSIPKDNVTELLLALSRPIHHVYPGSGNVLQKEIDNAGYGDVLLVYPGVYNGSVNINKDITLIGLGNPVIDAGGTGSVVSLTTGGSTIAGFTLVNSGRMVYDSGIKVTSDRNKILNNKIDGHQYGISLSYPANNNLIKNNTIINNTLEGISGTNIHFLTIIQSNMILNNGDGVRIDYSWNVSFIDNTIAFNKGNGVTINYTQETNIKNNKIEYNSNNGIYITNGARDIIDGNAFFMNGNNGLMMEQSLDPELKGNQIDSYSSNEYMNRIRNNNCNQNTQSGLLFYEITALIDDNTCQMNSIGIRIIHSAVLASGNTASKNGVGILLTGTETCVLRRNTITKNEFGIYVDGMSINNNIDFSNISMNKEYGIVFGPYTKGNSARENTIYDNLITNVLDDSGSNLVYN